jgi:hypothetical protein
MARFLKFETILRYVALPSISMDPSQSLSQSDFRQRKVAYDGRGRTDFSTIFDWLRDNGVKRILRVMVDDGKDPPHSDEAIESALRDLNVEVWDWRRHDICSETIRRAAPNARVVYLYSSGNNAVLREWSGPDGLITLPMV